VKTEYFKNFITICELGSFSAAAKKLKKSQGAISQQISLLEKEFGGVKLFKRSLKGVQLTSEGNVLLKSARRIVDELIKAKNEINEHQKTVKGTLRISASTIPGEHVLPKYFIQFKMKHPSANFEILSADSYKSMLNLENETVDLAASGSKFESSMNLDKYEFLPLVEEELVVIVPTEHEFSKKSSIELKDLLKYPFITREESSGTRRESEKIFEEEKMEFDALNIYLELASTESIITAVSEGIGTSIISSIAAEKAVKAGLVIAIKLKTKKPPKRYIYLMRKKADKHSVLLDNFWEFIKNKTKDLNM